MLSGLIAAVAVMALAAGPADRLVAAAVRRRVASLIQAGSRAAGRPMISVAGRAFLPQLLAGRYREVRVTIGACAPGGLDLSGLTARLTDVRAPLFRLAGLRLAGSGEAGSAPAGSGPAGSGAVRTVRADQRRSPVPVLAGGIDATAVIGLAALSSRLPAGLRLRPHGKDLRITGTYLLVPVRGTLAVTASREQITVTPKLTGVTAPVGFVIGLPGLPGQIGVAAVRVTGAGLEVTLSGTQVELGNLMPR